MAGGNGPSSLDNRHEAVKLEGVVSLLFLIVKEALRTNFLNFSVALLVGESLLLLSSDSCACSSMILSPSPSSSEEVKSNFTRLVLCTRNNDRRGSSFSSSACSSSAPTSLAVSLLAGDDALLPKETFKLFFCRYVADDFRPERSKPLPIRFGLKLAGSGGGEAAADLGMAVVVSLPPIVLVELDGLEVVMKGMIIVLIAQRWSYEKSCKAPNAKPVQRIRIRRAVPT